MKPIRCAYCGRFIKHADLESGEAGSHWECYGFGESYEWFYHKACEGPGEWGGGGMKPPRGYEIIHCGGEWVAFSHECGTIGRFDDPYQALDACHADLRAKAVKA